MDEHNKAHSVERPFAEYVQEEMQVKTPEQGFTCNACHEGAKWDDMYEVTIAVSVTSQMGTLIAYKQVCSSCMTKHAPYLPILLTQEARHG